MNEKINTPPSERPTPITDDTERKARIGHQSLTDGQWPWLAISEGWNHARNLERQLTSVREQRDRLSEAISHCVDRIEGLEEFIDGQRFSRPSVSGALTFAKSALKGATNEPR